MAFDLPSSGTRRLKHLLSVVSTTVCLVGMVMVLAVHGAPYWRGWWIVMAGILLGVYVGARWSALAVEWVIVGYRRLDR